jgi:hypothetical protein
MVTCWRFAILFPFIILSGCGSVINAAPLPSDNLPAYKQIIRAALQAALKPDEKPGEPSPAFEFPKRIKVISGIYAPYEISSPRQMNIVGGWMWRVCLKGNNKGNVIYLSVFIKDDYIADLRTSVAIDGCGNESYEPL